MARAALTVVLALAVVSVAIAAPSRGPARPHLRLTAADGALALASSDAGKAILQAPNLRPGATVRGTARIANTGGAAARLTLGATIDQERLGVGGARLSDALQLIVADANAALYRGSLRGLANRALGTLPAGASRSYRFTVTLPSTASNALQGARVSATFAWTATEVEPTATPATPATPAAAAVTPAPLVATPEAPVIAMTSARRCRPHGRVVIRVSPPDGTTIKRTDVKVGGARAKRYRNRKVVVRVRGRQRVKVTVRLSDGRRATARRSYRAC